MKKYQHKIFSYLQHIHSQTRATEAVQELDKLAEEGWEVVTMCFDRFDYPTWTLRREIVSSAYREPSS